MNLKSRRFFALNGQGFVALVDYMGEESAIVQAARVSYGAGTKTPSDDATLIRYLMRHRHTTPLEMIELKFLVRVPMDCWRQWIRHRTASVNEYSTRYSEAIDEKQVTPPDAWRPQSGTNKQGSGSGTINWPEGYISSQLYITPGYELSEEEKELHDHANRVYNKRLEFGVAREQARKDLPLSTFTEAYWKIDLHNLLHFLSLRMESHAQQEIREYATIIGREIVAKLFPNVWKAFEDYRLNALTLTGPEIEIIKEWGICVPDEALTNWNKREAAEFKAKLERLSDS